MLFGNRQPVTKALTSDKIDTVIGKNTSIKGDVNAQGILRVEGSIEGKINCKGDLILAEGGILRSDINADNIVIAGDFKGNMDIKGKLEIKSTGKVVGDINILQLSVEEGGRLDGKCNMKAEEEQSLKLVKNNEN